MTTDNARTEDGVQKYESGERVRRLLEPPSPVPVEPTASEQAVAEELAARVEAYRKGQDG